MKRVHVCSWIGPHGESCPNLAPCPTHSRPRNQPWSKDRDRKQQRRFREAVLSRDGYRCRRCGHHDPTGRTLVAHHVKPGYDPSAGIATCDACHKAIDISARARPR